jgi:SAM-dependent methyltransferase
MSEVIPDAIMRIALGFMAAKHLFVANEIGVFEKLAAGPMALDELAAASGIPRRTLRISADAMVSIGLLERVEGRYCNSPAAAAFLAGAAGPDLRPMLRFWDKLSYPRWINLENAVRGGEGQEGFFRFDEEQQQIFSTGVEAFSAPAAAALATAYDFGRHRRVLDVAGGTGSFLIAILRRYPGLRGTLFELPDTCAVARRRLAREPEGARIELIEGDLVKDALPDGHDAVIAANIVHGLSEAHNLDLLRSIRNHVAGGTRLLLVDLWMDASRTQPPAALLMSGEFLIHSSEGQSYAEDDADGWLDQTGWRKLERRPLAGPASVIIAEAD